MARNGIIRQHAPIAGRTAPQVLRPPPPPERTFAPRPAPPAAEEVHYPDGDGSFLCENYQHSAELIYAAQAIEQHLCYDRFTLMVDVHLFYEEGQPAARLGPDLLVVLDHKLRGTSSYKTWIEGRLPDFILEVVSPSSVENDYKLKKGKYAQLGVKEYFLYDPDLEEEEAHVLGYRLDESAEAYGDPLPAEEDGSIRSPGLGISLRRKDSRLVIRDEATGEDYQSVDEVRRMLDTVRAETAAAAERTAKAEERLQADRARTAMAEERLQADRARTAMAEERLQADRARADRAEAKADRAEAKARHTDREIQRLKQQLATLQQPTRRPLGR